MIKISKEELYAWLKSATFMSDIVIKNDGGIIWGLKY